MINLINDLNKMLNVRDFEIDGNKLRGPGKFEQIIKTDNQKFTDDIEDLSDKMEEQSQTINAITEFLTLESALSKQLSNVLMKESDSKIEVIADTKNISAIEAAIEGKIQPQLITFSEVKKTVIPRAILQIDKNKIATNPGKITISTVMRDTKPIITSPNSELQISDIKINHNIEREGTPSVENEYHTIVSQDCKTANIVLKVNGYSFKSDPINAKNPTIHNLIFKAETTKSPIKSFRITLSSPEAETKLQDIKNSLDKNIQDIQIATKYESTFDGGNLALLSDTIKDQELAIEEVWHDQQSNQLHITINGLEFKSDTLDKVEDLKHIELTNNQNKEKAYLSFTEEKDIKDQIKNAQQELSVSFIMDTKDDAQSLLKKIANTHKGIAARLAGNVLILTKSSRLDQDFRLQNLDGILKEDTEIIYTDSQEGYVKYENIKIPLSSENKLEITQEEGSIKITVKEDYAPNPLKPTVILRISDNLEEKYNMLNEMLKKFSDLFVFLKEQNEYDYMEKTFTESAYLGKNSTMRTISQAQIRALEKRLSIPDFPIRVIENKIEYTTEELKYYVETNPELKDVRKAIPPLLKTFNNKFNAEREMKKIREDHQSSRNKQEKLEDEKYEKYKQNVIKMANVMKSINVQNKKIAGLTIMMDNLNRRE
ncbi:hypothetical protein GUI12_00655 [Anaplasmataceae bacterium AB001_6]|nr:hypothetical protein GUI12_00655 [Anaplasmataceae bacterium AB001_6]